MDILLDHIGGIQLKCPECGKKIKNIEQKYCENCGYDLIEGEIKSNLNLFDLRQKFYIMTENYWKHGSGKIFNENGEVIGFIEEKNNKILIKNSDGSLLALISSKPLSLHHEHRLRDPDGNLIARYKKKMVTNFRSIFYLEDKFGHRWYEAYGEFMDFRFNVKEIASEKILAEFDKAQKWNDQIVPRLLKHYDSYALKINDQVTDRKILLGFVLGAKYIIYDVF
ncbi:MAG: LURP-one-related family protein [Candidatus Odinarchaeota archaeon]